MPDLPISGLPELTAITSNAEFVIEQSGVTYKIKNSVLTPAALAYGVHSQTGDSIVISATTVESSLLNGGVGSLTIPASGFTAGSSFLAKLGGVISAKVNDTLTIRVKAGSVVLVSSGAILMPNITNKIWLMEITFTIRKIGGPTVGSIVSLGDFIWSNNINVQEGYGFNNVNNTTFDTTISNTLDITVQWSSSSIDNSIYSDVFVLTKTF